MSEKSERLDGIDWLRGIVMVLMALDHARDYFGDLRVDPTDLDRVSTGMFMTRWVTHFCAPVFVLLAGVGAFLYGARRSKGQLSAFLWTRGLWLVVLEFTAIHFGWWGTVEGPFLLLQVIAAIGLSMMLLGAVIWLPHWTIASIGVGTVALHNLLDPVVPGDFGAAGWLWTVLHEDGVTSAFQPIPLAFGYQLIVIYAILPWFGVMAAGYGLGPLFLRARAERRRVLVGLGVAMTLGFVFLRATGLHGNFAPWESAGLTGHSVLGFLDCQKYPPSLVYLLMTLGPAAVVLAILDREPGWVGRIFVVFGRVPLFYYVLHVFLLQYGSRAYYLLRYGTDVEALPTAFSGQPFPPFYGNSLGVVYLSWLVAVALLYLPCRWFAGVKLRSRAAWTSYL